jgi:signal peptidase II
VNDRLTALAIAAAVVLVDQVTKAWALEALPGRVVVVIGDFLRFALVRNPGGAFSSFQNGGTFIAVAAVGVVFVVLYMVGGVPRRSDVVALGLILGGAVGNLVDRVVRGDGILDGEVIDWIDWWFIPTFNVADAAITIGVTVLLIGALIGDRKPTNQAAAVAEDE